jgi:hypothetical protein
VQLDRKEFLASIGEDAVNRMSDEEKADALEEHLMSRLNQTKSASNRELRKYPTAAEVEAQIETRPFRRGAGNLFVGVGQNVKRLPPMPAKPTLIDFFNLRFDMTANHVLQSAHLARKNGMPEDIILACLLHDTVQELIKVDHGWWCAQLYEPYVSEKVAFAIRYHQALRFYEDKENGYDYPELYYQMFGVDYRPEPYIEAAYQMVRSHKWYLAPRLVTVNDLYSFEPDVNPSIDEFTDIIGRNFKQPKEGLGFDNTPASHMWRTLMWPTRFL